MVHSNEKNPRRIAERKFFALRSPAEPIVEQRAIKIYYPERFPSGKALLVIGIPTVVRLRSNAAAKYVMDLASPHAPAIDGDRKEIMLFIPCHAARSTADVVRLAHEHLARAKKILRFRDGHVTPFNSQLIMIVRRLRAL